MRLYSFNHNELENYLLNLVDKLKQELKVPTVNGDAIYSIDYYLSHNNKMQPECLKVLVKFDDEPKDIDIQKQIKDIASAYIESHTDKYILKHLDVWRNLDGIYNINIRLIPTDINMHAGKDFYINRENYLLNEMLEIQLKLDRLRFDCIQNINDMMHLFAGTGVIIPLEYQFRFKVYDVNYIQIEPDANQHSSNFYFIDSIYYDIESKSCRLVSEQISGEIKLGNLATKSLVKLYSQLHEIFTKNNE